MRNGPQAGGSRTQRRGNRKGTQMFRRYIPRSEIAKFSHSAPPLSTAVGFLSFRQSSPSTTFQGLPGPSTTFRTPSVHLPEKRKGRWVKRRVWQFEGKALGSFRNLERRLWTSSQTAGDGAGSGGRSGDPPLTFQTREPVRSLGFIGDFEY